jgi:PAS domain S-box-containing protein
MPAYNLANSRSCFAVAAKLLRLLSAFGMFIGIGLASMPAMALVHASSPANMGLNALVLCALAGMMLMASFYLIAIWFVFRELSQVLLVGMLLLLILHMIFSNDVLLLALNVRLLESRTILSDLAMIGFLSVCIGFTVRFLDFDSHFPKLRLALLACVGVLGLGLTILLILRPELVASSLPFIAAITIGALLLLGFVAWREGISGSFVHSLAFLAFLIGVLTEPLRIADLIEWPMLISDTMLYGSAASAAVIFAVAIAQQFTRQQEIKERALQQSNERFSLAAQGANEGLYDWNLGLNRAYFSERLKRIVGRNLGNNPRGLRELLRLIVPEDRLRLLQQHRQFRRSDRRAMSAEFRVKRKDGAIVWVFATAVAMRHKVTHRLTRMVGSVGDITAKKQGENALRLSEARFRSITEAHPVPVLIVKLRDYGIVYASPGAEPLVEASPAALIGTSLERLLGLATPELLRAIQAHRKIDMHEAKLYHRDGSTVPVAVSGRLIDYQNEAAVVIGLYDLTERQRAEAQIAEQQEALQQSEKMAALGGLLAGVAHELNNPLSVIVGQATLLRETAPDKKIAERGDKIFTAAERCSRIVKSFLAIARRKPPEHRLMQLNEAVTQALELLAYPLRTENAQLKLELAPDLPQIIGDQDQFVQVVSNLVLNAAQAMKDWGGARYVTIRTSYDPVQMEILLAVIDTGPGIPAEIKNRVFEPFFTTKAPGSGTGVGLSLCHSIVTSHGGRLSLEDTSGGGASFIIHMPLPAKDQALAASGVAAELKTSNLALPPLKILLVDDEFELAQTLADMLSVHGHSFDFAINGKIALDKLRAQNFDFILSDLRMPEMDGAIMYKHILAEMPRYRHRILFITGDTLTHFVRDFLQQNPVRFIEKPYTLNDVLRAMSEQWQIVQQAGESG